MLLANVNKCWQVLSLLTNISLIQYVRKVSGISSALCFCQDIPVLGSSDEEGSNRECPNKHGATSASPLAARINHMFTFIKGYQRLQRWRAMLTGIQKYHLALLYQFIPSLVTFSVLNYTGNGKSSIIC